MSQSFNRHFQVCFSTKSRECLDYELAPLRSLTTISKEQIDRLKVELSNQLHRLRIVRKGNRTIISHWGYIGAIIDDNAKTLEVLSPTNKSTILKII